VAFVASAGHTVRLTAPKLATPYRMTGKRGKNDAADAATISEAMQRPNMRFVPVKSEEQQSRLMVHRARQGLVTERTAWINRICGLLSEFGIVLPLKAEVVRQGAAVGRALHHGRHAGQGLGQPQEHATQGWVGRGPAA
jgi:transposase